MTTETELAGVIVSGSNVEGGGQILTPLALSFVAMLHRKFNAQRRTLLGARRSRQEELAGIAPGAHTSFPGETASIRKSEWQVARAPADLEDRRVEITGPADLKMMINALNSGARVFMADLEDSCSPTWENLIEGQLNLMGAVRRTLSLDSGGKSYRLGETLATLVVRPRGWHMDEHRLFIDGEPASATLVDFGLYFFHNAAELMSRGSGPYFYLPKLESHREARLWNEVFIAAQELLGVPRGTIRATVLIETLPAAFEMEEILFELREHAAGLNAGRWDYLFSFIKTFRSRADKVLPDRSQLTMGVPFMRAYAGRLASVCHKRGAHAIGGMSAFIPRRGDAEVNARAFAKVREDKVRECSLGFDGTWVAHPDLVPVARAVFDSVLGSNPHQKHVNPGESQVTGDELVDAAVPDGMITAEGVRMNIEVALRYIDAWLRGFGAVAIHNLMEDAATAEISRTQLWQWIRHASSVDGHGAMTGEYYRGVRDAELARLRALPDAGGRLDDAAALLDSMVLSEFEEFLTLRGSQML